MKNRKFQRKKIVKNAITIVIIFIDLNFGGLLSIKFINIGLKLDASSAMEKV